MACDGMRVRAEAGAASFHRRPTLERHLAEAEEQVRLLKEEFAADAANGGRRRRASDQRGAEDRAARRREALRVMADLQAKPAEAKLAEGAAKLAVGAEGEAAKLAEGEAAKLAEGEAAKLAEGAEGRAKKGKGKTEEKELRVSSTEAAAQVMKMPDGGYRPAFNVQFATDSVSASRRQ